MGCTYREVCEIMRSATRSSGISGARNRESQPGNGDAAERGNDIA